MVLDARFLLISGSDTAALAARDVLAGYRDVEVRRAATDVLAAAGTCDALAGLLIIEPLLDATGAQLAALVRESRPGLPILLATPPESLTTNAWRAAHRLGALHAPLPLEAEDLLPFVTRALIGDVGGERRLVLALEREALRARLKPIEVEILALATRGQERSAIEARLRLSPTACKRRVQGLLEKLAVESLHDAASHVLRIVSGISLEPPSP